VIVKNILTLYATPLHITLPPTPAQPLNLLHFPAPLQLHITPPPKLQDFSIIPLYSHYTLHSLIIRTFCFTLTYKPSLFLHFPATPLHFTTLPRCTSLSLAALSYALHFKCLLHNIQCSLALPHTSRHNRYSLGIPFSALCFVTHAILPKTNPCSLKFPHNPSHSTTHLSTPSHSLILHLAHLLQAPD